MPFRAARRRRLHSLSGRAFALTASLLAHLGLLYFAVAAFKPRAFGPPAADQVAISLTLGGGLPPSAAPAPAEAAGEVQDAQPETVAEPSSAPAAAATAAPPPEPEPADAPAEGGAPSSARGALPGGGGDSDPWAQASLIRSAGDDPPPLGLLAQACWEGAFSRTRIAVLVRLDEGGNLIGSPQPLRPAGVSPTSERLEMENRIGAAVRKCAPYRRLASSTPTTHEVAFGMGVSD